MAELLVIEKRDQDNDRDRNAQKPKQNPTTHIVLLDAIRANIEPALNHRSSRFVPGPASNFSSAGTRGL